MIFSLLFQAVENFQRTNLALHFCPCCPCVHSSLVSIPPLARFCRNSREQDRPLLPGPELGGDDIYWPAANRSFGVVLFVGSSKLWSLRILTSHNSYPWTELNWTWYPGWYIQSLYIQVSINNLVYPRYGRGSARFRWGET